MSIIWSLGGFTKSKGSKFSNIKNFAIASYLEVCVSPSCSLVRATTF